MGRYRFRFGACHLGVPHLAAAEGARAASGRRQQPPHLVNDAGGYRLIVNADQVDSLRFVQLGEKGLLSIGEPDRALDRFEMALRLWRGRPFAAAADPEWATAAIARLDELFGQLQEQRVEAMLRVGPQTGLWPPWKSWSSSCPYGIGCGGSS